MWSSAVFAHMLQGECVVFREALLYTFLCDEWLSKLLLSSSVLWHIHSDICCLLVIFFFSDIFIQKLDAWNKEIEVSLQS